METTFPRLTIIASLVASTFFVASCKGDKNDKKDPNAVVDLDIGGDVTLAKGEQKQLTATARYGDGHTEVVTSNADLVWSTANASIAAIGSGVLIGMRPGKTSIQATFQGTDSPAQAVVVSADDTSNNNNGNNGTDDKGTTGQGTDTPAPPPK